MSIYLTLTLSVALALILSRAVSTRTQICLSMAHRCAYHSCSTRNGRLQLRSSFASIIENITFRRFFELIRQYIYQKKENRKSDTNPLCDSLRQLVATNGGRKTTTFANDLEKMDSQQLIALHDRMAPTCDQRPNQIEVPPSCPHLPTSLPHSRLRTSTNLMFCRLRRWSSCSGRQTTEVIHVRALPCLSVLILVACCY